MTTVRNRPSSADVYAGDVASTAPTNVSDETLYIFNIKADAEPGTFSRIANVLNIANAAPNRVNLERIKDEATLRLFIELDVGPNTAQSIQRKLAQLTDVIQVDLRTATSSGAK